MARNEEKQLARLNRFYLQQNKEEELRKRPPRPRLETLSTLDDIKKWIPSILKDIEFYIKQMEVACYPKKTIEEFERRISQLRGEYKAFVRKAHELEPELSATPWSDRPYSSKRQKLTNDKLNHAPGEIKPQASAADTKDSTSANNSHSFLPISAPLLNQPSSCPQFYGCRSPEYPPLPDIGGEEQDRPLDFNFSGFNKSVQSKLFPLRSSSSSHVDGSLKLEDHMEASSVYLSTGSNEASIKNDTSLELNGEAKIVSEGVSMTTNFFCGEKQPSSNPLSLPYTDSSSDEDT